MKSMMLSLGAALSLWMLPTTLQAQVPVVLICQDGSSQPGSSKVACGDHGGMDWEATKKWSEMRAGQFAAADTVVCTDGQARAAGVRACAGHGGVDSVSTLAAVKRRAQAQRFADRSERTTSEGGTVAGSSGADTSKMKADTSKMKADRSKMKKGTPKTREDSLKWGYPATRDAEVQNPPGYRGMERAIETFPPDTAESDDSAASADATTRVEQMSQPDSVESNQDQNPAGYRGMERPAGLDSLGPSVDSAAASVDSAAGPSVEAAGTSVGAAGAAADKLAEGTGMKTVGDTTHAKPMSGAKGDSTKCECE